MKGGLRGPEMEAECIWRDQNDNLERGMGSATVNKEVKSDSFCCVFLRIAG
jgi:hypothetical protein